jgi:hypothetical protein
MRRFSIIVVSLFCIASFSLGQAPTTASQTLPVLLRVDVTVLVENMAGDPSVLGEWGLAYLIETGRRRGLPGSLLLAAGRSPGPLRRAVIRSEMIIQAPIWPFFCS